MSIAQPVISPQASKLGATILARLRACTYDERMAILGAALDEVSTTETMSHADALEVLAERLRGIDNAKALRAMAEELEQTGHLRAKPVLS